MAQATFNSPVDFYDSIVVIGDRYYDLQRTVDELCKVVAIYCSCEAVRFIWRGKAYGSADVSVYPHCRRRIVRLKDDSEVNIEFYFAESDFLIYEKRSLDGTLSIALTLIKGILSERRLEHMVFEQNEHQKEQTGIFQVSRLLDSNAPIEQSLKELCNVLPNAWQYPEQTKIRVNYGGKIFVSQDFAETQHSICENFTLPDGRRGSIEAFIAPEVADMADDIFLDSERAMLVNIATMIAGSMTKHIYNRLNFKTTERLKELTAINRVSDIIGKGLEVKETLQLIVNAIPFSWQHADACCARLILENKVFVSSNFNESQWVLKDNFVTLDDGKGSLQVFYTKEFPKEFEGPFLKEERQLINVLARLICGYVNNYKGREILNNHPRKSSTAVSEDFRKTLTTGKQPLQLFFNKQIIEKYVYLDMMKYKIKNILFVATLYDAFILENEDSFFEQFMGEIYQYSLFSLPRITGVSSPSEALELMESTRFDIAILMVGLDTKATLDLSEQIKQRQNDLPVYLLLNQKNNLKYFEELVPTTPSIDKLFVWGGNSQILFSIVKSIEDNANVENDTKIGLVRVILLVEDSAEYYSKYLRLLFSIVFNQVQKLLVEEDRNEINKISKMRQRPKILHARNYEDAMYFYEKYKDFLLCVISDVEFERNGTSDPLAGYSLVRHMLEKMPTLPIVLQSADQRNKEAADQLGVAFLNKDSDSLQADLMEFLTSRLGFGDFIFRSHSGEPIAQAKGFREFETIFRNIPANLLGEYCSDNRISSWLMSRGEIPLARKVNLIKFDEYADPEKFRADMLKTMSEYRDNRRRGKILDYDEVDFPDEKNVISMASGSLGGKGRGLAFINTLIQNIDTSRFDSSINVRMPITAIIGTDEFADFMKRGRLYSYITTETDYMRLRQRFAAEPLSEKLMNRLYRFASQIRRPIAVRSSSLSEDSINQPFAGVFDTYLVPNNNPSVEKNVEQIATAIKMVYASIYSETSRTYFQTIRYNIEEEKMAVVLQVLVGEQFDKYYYPHISGTAQSYNYYPVAYMKPEEGFAVAGFGLGYYVVGGSKAFRFSPVWPNIDIMSTTDIVKNTQVDFLAVDLSKENLDYVHDGEHAPLATLDIMEAEHHGTLKHCASVYNPQNDTIEAGLAAYGPRVVNFADVLKYDYVPLASLISLLTNTAKDALGSPVEIEWAVDLCDAENGLPSFYLLQMKPIITELQGSSVQIEQAEIDHALLYTEQSLGNGELKEISDIIYADPDLFDRMATQEMAKEIDYLNSLMLEKDKDYILIGPGRWGTRDRFIGIPVVWSQISKAKVIVEMSLPNFPLDSSLGSHFFHNVTSMNIGYLSVQDESPADLVNWNEIKDFQLVNQTKYFKHVRAQKPFIVKMNGRERRAVIAKNE